MTDKSKDGGTVERRIGDNVRRLRALKALSRSGLAGRAEVSYSSISAIERGEREPLASTLTKIAGALEVELGDLYAGVSWVKPVDRGDTGHIEVDRGR